VTEKTTLRKFRWFWPWQDDVEEEWLGKMAREGCHFLSLGSPGIYTFQRGKPKNTAYRLDYQTSQMKDREAYLKLFHDAGWEHAGKFSTWEYFRKEARAGSQPEIVADPKSKIQKFRKVLQSNVIFLSALILLGVFGLGSDPAMAGSRSAVFSVLAIILVFYSIEFVGIFRRINRLQRTARK
jgi:type IV secretory pathway VirB2 component (pilin)